MLVKNKTPAIVVKPIGRLAGVVISDMERLQAKNSPEEARPRPKDAL
jgi:hypothetical protein